MVDHEQQIYTVRILQRIDLIVKIQPIQIGQVLTGVSRIRVFYSVTQSIDALVYHRRDSLFFRVNRVHKRCVFEVVLNDGALIGYETMIILVLV